MEDIGDGKVVVLGPLSIRPGDQVEEVPVKAKAILLRGEGRECKACGLRLCSRRLQRSALRRAAPFGVFGSRKQAKDKGRVTSRGGVAKCEEDES